MNPCSSQSPHRGHVLAVLASVFFAASGTAQCTTPWQGIGAGPVLFGPPRAAVEVPYFGLVVSGGATLGTTGDYVTRWDGGSWSPFGSSLNGSVVALATLPSGDLVAGGIFTMASGLPTRFLARWTGTGWTQLGGGIQGSGGVYALLTLPNGDLVAGGWFATAGGVPANGIARFDGLTWSAFGTHANWSVNALAVMPNGDIVAAASWVVMLWDGSSWTQLGAPMNGSVIALTALPNGDLIAGGGFSISGGVQSNGIARWDGSSWSALGSGVSYVGIPLPWQPAVRTLTTLPNGDVLAGGSFNNAGGVAAEHVARWNGTTWSPVGTGANDVVAAVARRAGGDLVVVGEFTVAGGVAASRAATLTTTCPAVVTPFANGCAGSGGANVLAATSQPWIGATFRSRATGMPANSLAVGVRGLSTVSIPLVSLLPQGQPGCGLWVNADLLDLMVPDNGAVDTQFAIPGSVSLIGQVLYQQVIAVDLDAQANIASLTSTNGLALAIGSF